MVYLFMADGTEELESVVPLDVLRRGGVEIITVGVTGKTVKLSHGLLVNCDKTLEELDADAVPEAVILPGGMPGTINLENAARVHHLIDLANQNHKLLCAICAAPSILGHKHILEGKRAISFPGFEKDLYGALVCKDQGVVRDGNIITARGAGVALPFALEILAALTSKEKAAEVAGAMQCQ